jgi:hypothetical protein
MDGPISVPAQSGPSSILDALDLVEADLIPPPVVEM